jgi:hypothetical protein
MLLLVLYLIIPGLLPWICTWLLLSSLTDAFLLPSTDMDLGALMMALSPWIRVFFLFAKTWAPKKIIKINLNMRLPLVRVWNWLKQDACADDLKPKGINLIWRPSICL